MENAAMDNNQPWAARRVNLLASALNALSYLEIGVAEGHTFAEVTVAEKTGVDPAPALDPGLDDATRSRVVLAASDDFFASASRSTTFDLVYLDGLHTFEQTYRDLCNVLLHSHVGTAILVDDTVPADVYSSIPDKPRSVRHRSRDPKAIASWSGDVYKVVLAVRDFHFGLNYRTIVGSGNPQTLIWRSTAFVRAPILGSFEQISRFSYFDLMDDMTVLKTAQEDEAVALCVAEIRAAGYVTGASGRTSGDDRTTAKVVAERDALAAQLENQRRLVAKYSTSRSWRLTEPLRAAGRFARRFRSRG